MEVCLSSCSSQVGTLSTQGRPALGRGVPTQECEFHFDSDQPEIPSFCNIAREHEITYQLTVALKDSKENLEFELCFDLTTH